MRKNNKNFVVSMIITAVVGLVVLMTMMLLGVKYFIGQDSGIAAMGENKAQRLSLRQLYLQ